MTKDPYQVLGVARTATDDEIKKAYRELARKYHPDNYQQDPTLAELAGERMKEINEAYEAIQAERSGKGSSSSQSSSYQGSRTTDPRFLEIRSLINQRRFSDAEIRLDSMSSADRGAEWHFLSGCVLMPTMKEDGTSTRMFWLERAPLSGTSMLSGFKSMNAQLWMMGITKVAPP